MSILEEIKNAIITYKPNVVKECCTRALEEGFDPQQILNEGIIAGMNVVGEKFKRNEVYVPEVLIAAKATHAGLDILKPLLSASETNSRGVIVIGTVKEDLHDIGKNLVAMMLEGAGFQVINLGIDIAPEKFVQAARDYKADIIAMSCLITSTLNYVPATVKAFEDAGLRDKVKIIAGGAAITEEFARKAGCDGYGKDAAAAVDVANELLKVS
ncbi:Cobalamin (vitamin B12)-binding domain [Moorella glycerini]|uniref:Methionine synthase n=2 Tax=Neomoorella TaxID=44260 RepID=A0A9X7J4F3_9FIRM|nr:MULTISPECIES: corrinoid protein [Moorella]PRR74333.1 Methionine synthase [Moorella stamsii]QGP91570.1 Glutamate mutase sigma subunit [Moorella glycerini]CEP66740.1 Cobalamin (vitamin B12)-binding domain [Moorella glycerini]